MAAGNLLQFYTTPIIDHSLIDLEQPVVFPHKTTPGKSLRYFRAKRFRASPRVFGPSSILSNESDRPEWSSFVHPEGLRYYHNATLRVTTDVNMRDDRNFRLVTQSVSHLITWMRLLPFTVQEHQEIVIEFNDEQNKCGYYLVDHQYRTVFYPDETDTKDIDLRDAVSLHQLKVELKRQYWLYAEYFPMHKDFGPLLKSELLGILLHSTFDGISSSNSTSVIGTDESLKYVKIIRNFTGTVEARGYEQCIMARIMEDLMRGRVIHYHGVPEGARMARREYIDDGGEPEPRAVWFAPISFLLMGQPRKRLQVLESLSVNFIFYKDAWKQFNESHVSEWKRVSGMSLGLMVVDVISLSYSQKSQEAQGLVNAFASQVGWHSGVIAALSCFGSLIVALTAINVHQPYSLTDAGDAAVYFQNAYDKKHGFQPLAIVLSLPSTMFLWALSGTAVGFAALSLQNGQIWSMGILGSIFLLMASLVLWAARSFRTGNDMILSSLFGSIMTPVENLPTQESGMDLV